MKGKVLVALIKVLGKIPLWLSYKIAVVLANIIYLIPFRENKHSKKNIDLVFTEQSEKDKNILRKKSAIETMKTLLESPRIWQLSPEKVENLIVKISGKSLIDEALASKHGAILAVPHLGSWELLGVWLPLHYQTTSLYRESNFPAIDKIVQESRSKNGANLVPNTSKGIIALVRGLKNYHVTGILPDQDPGGSGSVFVDFFKIKVSTSTLIPKLAQKTGAKVIIASMIRLKGNQGFALSFKQPDERVYNAELSVSALALNQSMEKVILENKEQYMWSYNRFKSNKKKKIKKLESECN